MRNPIAWSDLEIQDELGAGKAGVVRRAQLRRTIGQLAKGELVAVKQYKAWLLEEPGQFERIFRELDAGRKIAHPHLVKSFGVVADDQGRPALVMKYYDGESLQQFLARHREEAKPIEIDAALSILKCLAGALATLHASRIIHRDVKPANVMLTSNGAVLMDLGVVASGDLAQGTTTADFLGTIRYAAPEYLFGQPYDVRADVFSFGAIAYELLFCQEFDADTQHWADLVAKRKFDYRFSWNADQRASLTRQLGVNCLEFFVGILENSLTDRDARNLDLLALETAIAGKYWNAQFHFVKGKCVLGAPAFHPLGDFHGQLALLSFSETLEQLTLKLTSDQQAYLRRLLEKYYWEPEWMEESRSPIMEALVSAGALTGRNEFWQREFHPAVKFAYRYGLL